MENKTYFVQSQCITSTHLIQGELLNGVNLLLIIKLKPAMIHL